MIFFGEMVSECKLNGCKERRAISRGQALEFGLQPVRGRLKPELQQSGSRNGYQFKEGLCHACTESKSG